MFTRIREVFMRRKVISLKIVMHVFFAVEGVIPEGLEPMLFNMFFRASILFIGKFHTSVDFEFYNDITLRNASNSSQATGRCGTIYCRKPHNPRYTYLYITMSDMIRYNILFPKWRTLR